MTHEVNGVTYLIEEAHVNDVDLSLMGSDMVTFQKSVFAASVSFNGEAITNPSLKLYLALMPKVMEVNGFGNDEVGND